MSVVLQHFNALLLAGTVVLGVDASAKTFEKERLLADVSVRHHLLPGVRLKARNPESVPVVAPPAGQAHASTNTAPRATPTPASKNTSSRATPTPASKNTSSKATPAVASPVAPTVAANAGSSEKAEWEPLCRQPVKVNFFGDFWVSPHGPAAQLKESLFDNVRPLLKWADFNVVNFEGNVTTETKRAFPDFPFALKQAPDSLKWLASMGVYHFTRANNHSMDFGWQGAQQTTQAMNKVGAQFTGIGSDLKSAMKPMWLEKDGVKIAIFSVTTTYPMGAWAGLKRPGVAHPTTSILRSEIEAAREQADFIVVAFHWGEELKPAIKPHQEAYAQQVLSAGVDLVVGHHAHLAQKIDSRSDNGMIVYGIGNFIFSSISRDAKFGLAAHVEFCKNQDESGEHQGQYRVVFTPLKTYNRNTDYKSRPMTFQEFRPFAAEYVKKGYFSSDLEFFIPSEKQVRQLSEWLQPRPQASKEGRAVN